MKDLDRYRGCLIGGAAGDALGYAVEFLDSASIKQMYGKQGITEYDLKGGKALISDDTQMTLFTANGLLFGTTRGCVRGIMGSYASYIGVCYRDWYRTQRESYPLKGEDFHSWLVNVPELFHPRAPGGTCLRAIFGETYGTPEEPVNHSKGCGGVMRVAPIGLYLSADTMPQEQIDRIGAEAAALTHGHPLGYIPAAALVHIVSLAAHRDDLSLSEIVADMKASIHRQFKGNSYLPAFEQLLDKAVQLSQQNLPDEEAIAALGEGWVAEETLAIAVYCALKYSSDFDKALIASVNHSGDSDSTGSVTGNILGAYLGLQAIPAKYTANLELLDVMTELADDLYHDCQINEYTIAEDPRDIAWEQKYAEVTYRGKNHD